MFDQPGGEPNEHSRVEKVDYWPDERGPLALLYVVTDTDAHLTAFADADWFRMPHEGEPMPEDSRLLTEVPGWPDEWTADDDGGRWICDFVTKAMLEGTPWGDVRANVEQAFLEQSWDES